MKSKGHARISGQGCGALGCGTSSMRDHRQRGSFRCHRRGVNLARIRQRHGHQLNHRDQRGAVEDAANRPGSRAPDRSGSRTVTSQQFPVEAAWLGSGTNLAFGIRPRNPDRLDSRVGASRHRRAQHQPAGSIYPHRSKTLRPSNIRQQHQQKHRIHRSVKSPHITIRTGKMLPSLLLTPSPQHFFIHFDILAGRLLPAELLRHAIPHQGLPAVVVCEHAQSPVNRRHQPLRIVAVELEPRA